MKYQTNRFKINYGLAFMLKNTKTKELQYYHSSFIDAQILETALLASNRKELLSFLNSLAEEFFTTALGFVECVQAE